MGPLGRIYLGMKCELPKACFPGGGGSEAPFGGAPFWWGPLGMCPVRPALNPALNDWAGTSYLSK